MYCNRLKLRFGCLFAFIITPIVFAMEVGEKDSTKNAKSKPSSISKLFLRKIAQEYSFDENSSDLDILHATIDIFDQFIIQTDFMVKVLETKKADCKKKYISDTFYINTCYTNTCYTNENIDVFEFIIKLYKVLLTRQINSSYNVYPKDKSLLIENGFSQQLNFDCVKSLYLTLKEKKHFFMLNILFKEKLLLNFFSKKQFDQLMIFCKEFLQSDMQQFKNTDAFLYKIFQQLKSSYKGSDIDIFRGYLTVLKNLQFKSSSTSMTNYQQKEFSILDILKYIDDEDFNICYTKLYHWKNFLISSGCSKEKLDDLKFLLNICNAQKDFDMLRNLFKNLRKIYDSVFIQNNNSEVVSMNIKLYVENIVDVLRKPHLVLQNDHIFNGGVSYSSLYKKYLENFQSLEDECKDIAFSLNTFLQFVATTKNLDPLQTDKYKYCFDKIKDLFKAKVNSSYNCNMLEYELMQSFSQIIENFGKSEFEEGRVRGLLCKISMDEAIKNNTKLVYRALFQLIMAMPNKYSKITNNALELLFGVYEVKSYLDAIKNFYPRVIGDINNESMFFLHHKDVAWGENMFFSAEFVDCYNQLLKDHEDNDLQDGEKYSNFLPCMMINLFPYSHNIKLMLNGKQYEGKCINISSNHFQSFIKTFGNKKLDNNALLGSLSIYQIFNQKGVKSLNLNFFSFLYTMFLNSRKDSLNAFDVQKIIFDKTSYNFDKRLSSITFNNLNNYAKKYDSNNKKKQALYLLFSDIDDAEPLMKLKFTIENKTVSEDKQTLRAVINSFEQFDYECFEKALTTCANVNLLHNEKNLSLFESYAKYYLKKKYKIMLHDNFKIFDINEEDKKLMISHGINQSFLFWPLVKLYHDHMVQVGNKTMNENGLNSDILKQIYHDLMSVFYNKKNDDEDKSLKSVIEKKLFTLISIDAFQAFFPMESIAFNIKKDADIDEIVDENDFIFLYSELNKFFNKHPEHILLQITQEIIKPKEINKTQEKIINFFTKENSVFQIEEKNALSCYDILAGNFHSEKIIDNMKKKPNNSFYVSINLTLGFIKSYIIQGNITGTVLETINKRIKTCIEMCMNKDNKGTNNHQDIHEALVFLSNIFGSFKISEPEKK